MHWFIGKEIQAVKDAEQRKLVASRRSEFSTQRVKHTARLWMATPQAMIAFFVAGAYKGAIDPQSSRQRRAAMFSMARTMMVNFLA